MKLKSKIVILNLHTKAYIIKYLMNVNCTKVCYIIMQPRLLKDV